MSIKKSFTTFIYDVQDTICRELVFLDGKGSFREDLWSRVDGGGGRTRVLEKGAVFEKAGVNISEVYGPLPEPVRERFGVEESWFFACGISLVLHPMSPMVPTVHANYRYFERYHEPGGQAVDSWFGGGADLTPWYLFEDDARHFHHICREACDRFDPVLYPRFKQACDTYFWNAHRAESRGVGGIFFDYLRDGEYGHSIEFWHDVVRACAQAFLPSYLPIVQRRLGEPWGEQERYFQELRRGRYAEFNLIHDRGTYFGLKTGGRIDSIFMSLPPRVRWDYEPARETDPREQELVQVLRQPRSWV